MRTITEIRAACAALPGSIETFPFDATTLVFKLGGERPAPDSDSPRETVYKMYALTGLTDDPVVLSLKCDPERGEALRSKYRAVTPGYHLDKRHWISVRLGDGVPDELVGELLRHSYDLVWAGLPRSVRDALEAK